MSDNPSVNRYLSDKAFDHIDHALGRPAWPERESFRNYFACDADGSLASSFAASPFWALSGVDGTMAYYHVTAAGRSALAQHLAEIAAPGPWSISYRGFASIDVAASRSKAAYRAFLRWREVMPDLRFIEFARQARVRRAA